MLPLKAFVNTLQNAVWNPQCLVRALPFLDGRLEHHHAGLVLKKLSDRFDVELPEFRHFQGRIMALGWGGCFHPRARMHECIGHCYLHSPVTGGQILPAPSLGAVISARLLST